MNRMLKTLLKLFLGDTETKMTSNLTSKKRKDLVKFSSEIPNTGEDVVLKLGDRYFRCRELC